MKMATKKSNRKSVFEKITPSTNSLTILSVILILLSLIYVHLKVEQTRIGYEISENKKKQAELVAEVRVLRAEFMKLKSPERLERIAKSLDFKYPTQEDVIDIIYVEPKTATSERR